MTPWGTYLSGEENFANYFDAGRARARTSGGGACGRAASTVGPNTTSASTPASTPTS
jgi:secreted PhoX family phosphatase